MKVYLDYAATAPVKKEVFEKILPYLKDDFGNPSSIHTWGRVARAAVDTAREKVARFLNCLPEEVIFTSGGTEADNLAIKGLVLPFIYNHKEKPHIITSEIEHHAVLNSCKMLEKNGIEVTYLKPDKDGLIKVEDVQKEIKDNTCLVSIMYVNNEVGTVQSVREIGKMIEKVNKQRLANNPITLNPEPYHPIFFHTDAVQASEYQNMNVDYLHVDLLTISGHKIGTPKGIGALFIRKGVSVMAMVHGGEQEMNMRAGTENVAGIVALGEAVEILRKENREKKIEKTTQLRDYFIDKVLQVISEVYLNGSANDRSPNNVNFYFKYIEGESILLNLDMLGIAASSGSACTSQSLQPSHVLMAIYDEAVRAHGSIRFTLGQDTTKEELDYTVKSLKEIVARLRAISPLTPALK